MVKKKGKQVKRKQAFLLRILRQCGNALAGIFREKRYFVYFFASSAKTFAFLAVKILTAKYAKNHAKYARKERGLSTPNRNTLYP